jgi:hypothetical protein
MVENSEDPKIKKSSEKIFTELKTNYNHFRFN